MKEVDAKRAGALADSLGDRDAAVSLLRKELEEGGLTERATVVTGGELSRLRGECGALRDRVKAQDEIIHGLMDVIEVAAKRIGGEVSVAALSPVTERAPDLPPDYSALPETPTNPEVPF